ncbi:MAG: thiolase C-terminal domain-containing protein [Candidatus Bathyarchaeales archaeon]
MAYKLAKIQPADVDLATVHDCFTIADLMVMNKGDLRQKGVL